MSKDFEIRSRSRSGISQLMDDLGKAMAGESRMRMLGGGNPAHIPAVQDALRAEMQRILDSPGQFELMVGNYDTPMGNQAFREALCTFFQNEFGWQLTPKHIVICNGSQSAFFALFNLLGGAEQQILLPLVPEYIGYADQGLKKNLFVARRPKIQLEKNQQFKYHVNFAQLEVDSKIGAICTSRPTNPTANVLTDQEIIGLDEVAQAYGIPFIIDNAYGTPFPNIIYTEAQPFWNSNTILSMSLSKFGLPAVRTGILVGDPSIMEAISEMNGVMGLAPGGIGPFLAKDLVISKAITQISSNIIQPFYKERMEAAIDAFYEFFGETTVRVHQPEGAMFLWLWFPDMKIKSYELYELLKKRGVLVVSGHYFFPGLDEDWPHKNQCIRITYSQSLDDVREAMEIIAEVVAENS